MNGPLTLEPIRTTAGLRALEPEWEELLRQAPRHSLTVTPQWMGIWWDIYGEGRQLATVAARDAGGRLVGMAPLAIHPVRHRGMLPFRRLGFLATGERQADFIGSDYLDFVVAQSWEPEGTRALAGYCFTQMQGEWDEALFQHIPGESPTLPALRDAAAGAALKCEEADRRSGVWIPLPGTWVELLAALNGDRRKQLLRRRRRLAEHGEVDFDWEVSASNFEERWNIVRDLHQRRWIALGKPGCFASDRFTRFHRRVAEALIPTGGIRMAILRTAGRPLACDYYYVHAGRVYAYQAGLDPEEGLRLSAGTLCISYGIEAAIAEGLAEYDFLKGVHTYKSDWSELRRDQVTLRVAPATVREHLRTTLESGIRLVRPLRRRLRDALAEVNG